MKVFARFLPFILLLAIPRAAQALETSWESTDYVQARLVSASDATGDGKALEAALELRLADGWHAYWRMPGDSGLPPALDWAASANVDNVEMSWPTPRRIEIMGLYSFGYTDSVMFPLSIVPQEPGKPVTLSLKASVMVCESICVPQDLALSLEIPAGAAAEGRYGRVIGAARDDAPHKGDLPVLDIKGVVIGPDALVVRAWSAAKFDDADLFVESGDILLTAPPQIEPDKDDGRLAHLRIPKPEGVENLAKSLEGQKVILTLTNGQKAIEKEFDF